MIDHPPEREQKSIAPPTHQETVQLVLMANNVARGVNLAAGLLGVTETSVCLALTAEVSANQEVLFTLESLWRNPVCLLGHVAWCRPFGNQWVAGIRLSGASWLPHFLKLTDGSAA